MPPKFAKRKLAHVLSAEEAEKVTERLVRQLVMMRAEGTFAPETRCTSKECAGLPQRTIDDERLGSRVCGHCGLVLGQIFDSRAPVVHADKDTKEESAESVGAAVAPESRTYQLYRTREGKVDVRTHVTEHLQTYGNKAETSGKKFYRSG